MPRKHQPSGYSLLEILAALTVLVLGFGALNSLTGAAQNNAILARDLSIVQQVCQTRMNELVAGAIPLRTIMDEPIPDLDDWTLSVTLDPTRRQGILVVAVSAKRHDSPNMAVRRGGRFRLVRWFNVAEPPQPRTVATPSQGGFSGTHSGAVRGGTLESLFPNAPTDSAPQSIMSDTGLTVDLPPLGLPDAPTDLPPLPPMESPASSGTTNW